MDPYEFKEPEAMDRFTISCSNVPNELFDKINAKNHFKKFGRVLRITFRPKQNICLVDFNNLDSVMAAIEHGTEFEGKTFQIVHLEPRSENKEQATVSSAPPLNYEELEMIDTAVPQRRSRSKERKLDPDWPSDPEIKAELEAMGALIPHEHSFRNKQVKSGERRRSTSTSSTGTKAKTSLLRSKKTTTSPIKRTSKKLIAKRKSKPIDPTQVSELLAVLQKIAQNSGDKYDILDARDKLVRIFANENVNNEEQKIVGTCSDMCPEKERYLRESKHQVSVYEQDDSTQGVYRMNHSKAIKQYSRSSADQEMPLLHELRPVAVLQLTMNYLLHNIIDQTEDGNAAEWYHFVWDRTRGIRKDITQQQLCCLGSVELVEQCARFHIHCAARLIEEDVCVFDTKINTENLTKCLQTLKYMYNDLELQGTHCPNEGEFRCYIILLNLHNANFMWEVKQLRPEVQKSKEVVFAIKVFLALDSNNYVSFFKLVRSASYLNACILLRYFNDIRYNAINRMIRTHSPRHHMSQLPINDLTRLLAFEDEEATITFLQYHELEVCNGYVTLDRGTFVRPSLPFETSRAINLIESKRGEAVSEIICGGILPPKLFEVHQLQNSFDNNGLLKKVEIKEQWLKTAENVKRTPNEPPKMMKKPLESGSKIDTKNIFAKPTSTSITSNIFTKTSDNVFGVKPTPMSLFSAKPELSKDNTRNIFGLKPIASGVETNTVVFGVKPEAPPSGSNLTAMFGPKVNTPIFGVKPTTNLFTPAAEARQLTENKNIFSSIPPVGNGMGMNLFSFGPNADVVDSTMVNKMPPKNEQFTEWSIQHSPVVSSTTVGFNEKPKTIMSTTPTVGSNLGTKNTSWSLPMQKDIPSGRPENQLNFLTDPKTKFMFSGNEPLNSPSKADDIAKRIKEEEEKIQRENERRMIAEEKRREEEKERRQRLEEEKMRQEAEERKIREELSRKKEEEEEHERQEAELRALLLEQMRLKLEREKRDEMERLQVIHHLLTDLLQHVETKEIEERLHEIKINTIVRKIYKKWRHRVQTIRKRKAVENSPIWLAKRNYVEEARELYTPNQKYALMNMLAYKTRSYRREKAYNLIETINFAKLHAKLKNNIESKLNTIVNTIFWKLTFCIPDGDECSFHLIRLFELLDNIFPLKRVDENRFLDQIHPNCSDTFNVSVEFCIGSNATVLLENCDVVFIGVNDVEYIDRLKERFFTVFQKWIPRNLVIILRNTPNAVGREKIIDILNLKKYQEDSALENYHLIFDEKYSNENLFSGIESSLDILAENTNLATPLLLNNLAEMLHIFVGNEFSDRLKQSVQTNLNFSLVCTDQNVLIQLYNEAVGIFKKMVAWENLQEYPDFPQEFKVFLSTRNTLYPCTYEYFPNYWRKDDYHSEIQKLIDSVSLPLFQEPWPPKNIIELQKMLKNYIKIITSNDKLILQVLTLVLSFIENYDEDFEAQMDNFPWIDIFQLIISYKIKEMLQIRSRYEKVVVYNRHDVNRYRTTTWWLYSSVVQAEFQRFTDVVDLNQSIAEPISSEETLNYDDFNIDDQLTKLLNVETEQRQQQIVEKRKKEMDHFKYLLDDLDSAMKIQNKAINKLYVITEKELTSTIKK